MTGFEGFAEPAERKENIRTHWYKNAVVYQIYPFSLKHLQSDLIAEETELCPLPLWERNSDEQK